jgi:hypothetical protein
MFISYKCSVRAFDIPFNLVAVSCDIKKIKIVFNKCHSLHFSVVMAPESQR